MRSCLLMLVALAAFLLLVALLPALALAKGPTAVEGKLTNGTAGAPPPGGVEVTLHVVQSTASVETNVGVTDEAGAFRIEVPMVDNVTSYVISLSYEGAVYGRALDLGELSEPADITVYENTSDLSVLEVNSAALVLRSQPDTEGMLSGSEVVSLVNTSDRTFIPDLTGPAMGQMNFMRFSLPPGATNLRLESDLAGGDIIDVGPGFAVTASVPPGDHLVGFSYSAPYDGDSLDFTRTAHMSTVDFHLLLPEDLGQVQSDALSVGDDRVLFGDDLFQAWRAGPLQAGEKVQMEFSGLPEPPWHQRLRETLLEGPGPQLFLASLLGLALVGALLYSLLRSVPSSRPALTTAPAGIVSSPQAQDCLRQLAKLDDALEQGEVAPDEYHERREVLKADLLQAWASEGLAMNGPDYTEPVAPEPGPDGERSRWWLSTRLLVIAALVPAAVLLGLLGWAITKPVTTSSGGSNTVFYDFDLEGREAPNFSLQGLDGATVQLADSRGKVVMVDFWASWCPSCRQEAPHLVELYEEYRGRGVEFIGVAIWDFPDDLNTYVEQFGLIYPNALDEKGTVAIEYGVVATPEKFFIDRDGNIVRKFVGPTSPELLRQQLDELLES